MNKNPADKKGTKRNRRLTLHRETLKALDAAVLRNAAGGVSEWVDCGSRTGRLNDCTC